jgi:hypothetical protein
MTYIIARLREPSTIRGIVLLLGLIGVKISPEQTDAISTAVVGLLAAVEVFRKESTDGK